MFGKLHSSKHKAGVLILILLLGFPILLAAQEEDDPSGEGEIDWENIPYELFARGDRTLVISLGVTLPMLFLNDGGTLEHQFDPPVGGTGSFVVNYFLKPKLTIGGELGGMFIPTVADNILYMIYLGFRIGTQFTNGRFEFPVSGSFGMAWQTYLDLGYFGIYLKASSSAFYRATINWAFGITTNWTLFPEWTDNSTQNVYGNFLDFTISARYHF